MVDASYKDVEYLMFFYKEIRAHIEHEDSLCNNRMSWLIALQAFLFSAYGFSLSAQATIQDKSPALHDIIVQARVWLALVGIVSAAAIFASLFAAILSIGKLVQKWYEVPVEHRAQFPQIIGNARPNFRSGTYLGQSPLVIVPLFSIVAWVALSFNLALMYGVIAASAFLFIIFIISTVSYRLGKKYSSDN